MRPCSNRTREIIVICAFATIVVNSSACYNIRHSIPSDASPEHRAMYAGKTIECAGKAQENAFWASLIGGVTSAGASGLTTSAALMNNSPATSLALSCTALGLACTSIFLSTYALVRTYEAARLHQIAGQSLAGQTDEACIEGKAPEIPPPPAKPQSPPESLPASGAAPAPRPPDAPSPALQPAPAEPARQPRSRQQILQELERLHDDGVLSDEEYRKKVAEVESQSP